MTLKCMCLYSATPLRNNRNITFWLVKPNFTVALFMAIERGNVTSRNHSSKIYGSKQQRRLFAWSNDGRKVWATVWFLSAVMHRKVMHVNFFRFYLPYSQQQNFAPIATWRNSPFHDTFWVTICTSPIIQLVCRPKLSKPLFLISPGYYSGPKRSKREKK